MTRFAMLLPLATLALGCASTPRPQVDPLRTTSTALSLAGIAITEASRAHTLQIEHAYRARVDACPVAPLEREACKAKAREDTLRETRTRTDVLKEAAALQNRAADLAEAAEACRRQGQACEEAKAKEAKAALDELGALLGPAKGSKTP